MDEEDFKKFKMHRKIMFFIGKTIKYICWAGFAAFIYHLYLIKKFKTPETEAPGGIYAEQFLEAARFVDWSMYDIKLLLTRPGMTKMLPDKIEFPG